MANLFRDFSKIRGGNVAWLRHDPAATLLNNEFFGIVPEVETVYLGAQTRAQRYLGSRTDGQLYLGTKTLFP